MRVQRLEIVPRLTRRQSREMIVTFAMLGNHNKQVYFRSEAEVEAGFEYNGIDFSELVDSCRDPNESVPFFENLLPAGWSASPGASITVTDSVTGKVRAELGPSGGTFFPDMYAATFEQAHADWLASIELVSPIKFLAAATAGVAAIESYLMHRTRIWNELNPADPLLDSHTKKVSFDDKLDDWIPKMTGGARLQKSDVVWADFRVLRSIRDDGWVHQKQSALAMELNDLVTQLNRFRNGIAMFLIRLHQLFRERIPRLIIRAAYSPDVRAIGIDNDDQR
jgi:hypothetical protein